MPERIAICLGCDVERPIFSASMCAPCYFAQPRRKAYQRWYDMVRRCTNPSNRAWKWYGDAGVGVHPEWRESFEAFYAAVGDAPEGMTLDRIDPWGDYEPGNVRWATPKEQRVNQRYDWNGIKTHCPQGHEYDVIRPDGRRGCRTCRREATDRHRERQKIGSTHCAEGHEFQRDKRGGRYCRECRSYRARKAAAA